MVGGITPIGQILQFQEAIEECHITNLRFTGEPFTWMTSVHGGVKKCLDKVFASRDWKDKYPAVVVRHLNPYKSNHIPILLEIFRRIIRNVKWLFREHKILLLWVSPSSKQKDIDGIQAKLGFILAQPISDVFLAEMANLLTQLDHLLSKEEAFWRQRAKNRIRELTNLQGTWSENIQEIENSVLGYFNNIIKSNQGSDLDADEIFDALDQKIDVDMLHVLEAEFMDTEVKAAFF
ncbi:hypothetical protein ACFX11_038518 [Malus domestica]